MWLLGKSLWMEPWLRIAVATSITHFFIGFPLSPSAFALIPHSCSYGSCPKWTFYKPLSQGLILGGNPCKDTCNPTDGSTPKLVLSRYFWRRALCVNPSYEERSLDFRLHKARELAHCARWHNHSFQNSAQHMRDTQSVIVKLMNSFNLPSPLFLCQETVIIILTSQGWYEN